MQLTRQSEIAIGMLVACARSADGYLHTYTAAAGTGASKDHAAKVAYLLLRGGFVASARGRHGGIRLARAPEDISVGAVLRCMQPRLTQSAREGAAEGSTAKLTAMFEAGWRGFVDLMDGFSIADLMADRTPALSACRHCHLVAPMQVAAMHTSRNERLNAHALPRHR